MVEMPTEEPKFPDDFKGWNTLYPILNNRYLVLKSLDGSKEAGLVSGEWFPVRG